MIKDSGGQALAVPAHMTDSEAVNRVVEATEKSFGPVDILINNAAVGGPSGPIWKQDVEDWRRTLETNAFLRSTPTHNRVRRQTVLTWYEGMEDPFTLY